MGVVGSNPAVPIPSLTENPVLETDLSLLCCRRSAPLPHSGERGLRADEPCPLLFCFCLRSAGRPPAEHACAQVITGSVGPFLWVTAPGAGSAPTLFSALCSRPQWRCAEASATGHRWSRWKAKAAWRPEKSLTWGMCSPHPRGNVVEVDESQAINDFFRGAWSQLSTRAMRCSLAVRTHICHLDQGRISISATVRH